MKNKTEFFDCEIRGHFRSDVMLDIAQKHGIHGGMRHSLDPETHYPTQTDSRVMFRTYGPTADAALDKLHTIARAYGPVDYSVFVGAYVDSPVLA